MRIKSPLAFFRGHRSFLPSYSYAAVPDNYTKMVNQARSHMSEMNALIRRQGKDKGPIHAIENQLEILITYHSLKLTDHFSLSLEDTTDLLKDDNTHHGRDFHEQLRAINHRKILNYCRQYQQQLYKAGWLKYFPQENSPDENILSGFDDLAQSFVLRFGEGSGGNFESMYGNYHPRGTFYFYDREEQDYITKGQNLLVQTLKQPVEDPFMNAAIIHNEFAKGHQFDKQFGLLFSRLYMNLALMITGHAPAIIDSTKKEEYLQIVQHENLTDHQSLATFLVKSMNVTYQNYILPVLEDGLPFYINLVSKQGYMEMLSEYKLAEKCFNEGNQSQAKTHIETAIKCALSLSGLTPLIIGTHTIELFDFERKIEEKIRNLKS